MGFNSKNDHQKSCTGETFKGELKEIKDDKELKEIKEIGMLGKGFQARPQMDRYPKVGGIWCIW